jgi:hypothetical protein
VGWLRSIQRTRLIHGALRYMVLNADKLFDAVTARGVQARAAWIETFRAPVNQLELVYTLMTFSHVTIRSAVRLGIHPEPAAFESLLLERGQAHARLKSTCCRTFDDALIVRRHQAHHAAKTDDADTLVKALVTFFCNDWPILSLAWPRR